MLEPDLAQLPIKSVEHSPSMGGALGDRVPLGHVLPLQGPPLPPTWGGLSAREDYKHGFQLQISINRGTRNRDSVFALGEFRGFLGRLPQWLSG